MKPLEPKTLVGIQPRHLKMMQVYLAQYFDLLCDQAEESQKMKEINELASLDFVIDTILGTHCNESA